MMEEGNVSGVGVTVGSVRYDEDDKAAGAASVGRTPAVTPRRTQMDEVGDLELSSRRLIGTSINGSVCSSVRAEGSQFTDVDEISASPGTLMWRTRSMMRRKVNNLSRAELKEYSKDLSVDFNAVPDERDAPVTGSTVASVNLISTNTMDSMRTMDSSGDGEVQAQSIGSKILHLIRENKRVRTGLKREAFARLGEWVAWVRRLETHAAHSAEPLSKDEITHIREQLVIEMGFGPSLHLLKTFDARDTNRADMVLFAIQELLCSPVGADVGKDATHAYTRQLIRSANKDKCCGVDGVQTAREWFTSLRKQISPRFTSNVVKESTLILGQGPNGGYAGYVPRQFAGSYALKSATIMAGGSAMPVAPPVSDVSNKSDGSKGGVAEEAGRLSSLWRGRFRASKPLKEWLLHGDDINQRRDLRAARDSEIAGFFSECIDLRIGSIVANGFVHAYDFTNLKTCAAAVGPFNPNLEDNPYASEEHVDSFYMKGACRDFFNYFGCPEGDDGVVWSHVSEGVRLARIAEFTVRSTRVGSALNHNGKPVTLYQLVLTFTDGSCGCLCQSDKSYTLNVLHVETVDQSSAELSMAQVSLLCDMLIDMQADHTGILIHCAGGIGRTGNLAMGMVELCCFQHDIPTPPCDKLLWLRSHRPSAVQTIEQFVDGVVLQAQILMEVLLRTTYKDYLMRYDIKEPKKPTKRPSEELLDWIDQLAKDKPTLLHTGGLAETK